MFLGHVSFRKVTKMDHYHNHTIITLNKRTQKERSYYNKKRKKEKKKGNCTLTSIVYLLLWKIQDSNLSNYQIVNK